MNILVYSKSILFSVSLAEKVLSGKKMFFSNQCFINDEVSHFILVKWEGCLRLKIQRPTSFLDVKADKKEGGGVS